MARYAHTYFCFVWFSTGFSAAVRNHLVHFSRSLYVYRGIKSTNNERNSCSYITIVEINEDLYDEIFLSHVWWPHWHVKHLQKGWKRQKSFVVHQGWSGTEMVKEEYRCTCNIQRILCNFDFHFHIWCVHRFILTVYNCNRFIINVFLFHSNLFFVIIVTSMEL